MTTFFFHPAVPLSDKLTVTQVQVDLDTCSPIVTLSCHAALGPFKARLNIGEFSLLDPVPESPDFEKLKDLAHIIAWEMRDAFKQLLTKARA